MATGLDDDFLSRVSCGNPSDHQRRGRQQQRRRHLNRVLDVEQILELLEELKQEQEHEKFEQSQRIRREQQVKEERELLKEQGCPEPTIECEMCAKRTHNSTLDSEAQRKQRYAQQKRRQKLQQRILDIELLQQFLRELKQSDTSDSEAPKTNNRGYSVFLLLFFSCLLYFTFLDVYKLF